MSNNNKGAVTILAVLVAVAVAGTGGYMIGRRMATPEAQVVASVNGEKITLAQLNARMKAEQGPAVIDRMITEKLVEQEAAKQKVSVTAADVDAEIAKIKEQMGGEEGLKQALGSNNMTMDQLKENIRFQTQVTKVLEKEIKTDDETLKKYFDDNISDFDTREVHARHILVNTEDEAKAIKAELDKGADFAALAKEKSIEPNAKTSGGDLGFFGHGKMDADFDKAAFSLKINEISGPVKSQFGWHIIQLLETKGDAPSFEAAKAKVKEAVVGSGLQEKYTEWITGLKDKAKIENSLAPAAK